MRSRYLCWEIALLLALPTSALQCRSAQRAWQPRELRPDTFAVARPQVYKDQEFDEERVTSLAWSPDGTKLAIGLVTFVVAFSDEVRSGHVEVWDVKTGKMLSYLDDRTAGHITSYSAAWSPSGKEVMAYKRFDIPSSISHWRTNLEAAHALEPVGVSGETEYSSQIMAASFSQSGKKVDALCEEKSTTRDKKTKVRWFWVRQDAATGQRERTQVVEERETAFQPFFNVAYSNAVPSAAFSHEAATFAFVASQGRGRQGQGKPSILYIGASATGRLTPIPLTSSEPAQLRLSSDGSTLALKTDTAGLTILNARTGTRKCRLKAQHIQMFALAPDGRTVATWDGSTAISLWDANTGACLGTMPNATKPIVLQSRNTGASIQLQFSPNSTTLAVARQDGTVALWRVR